MTMTDIDLDQLADIDDARAHEICDVADHLAPQKAMERRARAGRLLHRKIGNKIIFYLPQLRRHMDAQRAQFEEVEK